MQVLAARNRAPEDSVDETVETNIAAVHASCFQALGKLLGFLADNFVLRREHQGGGQAGEVSEQGNRVRIVGIGGTPP